MGILDARIILLGILDARITLLGRFSTSEPPLDNVSLSLPLSTRERPTDRALVDSKLFRSHLGS